MSINNRNSSGNILGSARAEADTRMLQQAFVETSDYLVLKDTEDFNFVVGRRGTGKTALYLRLVEVFSKDRRVLAYHMKPEEHDSLALLGQIRKMGFDSYDHTRYSSRVLWRASLLFTVAVDLCQNWKFKSQPEWSELQKYITKRKHLRSLNEVQRCYRLLLEVQPKFQSLEQLPGLIASETELSTLEELIKDGLEAARLRAIFLFDGLDEGWGTDILPIAILGGLAIAISGFKDADVPVHGEIFIRDNIFRALATQDRDYSRHIEGNTLRLHWDEDSLFNFVTSRLRVVLNMQEAENNTRVWNRFAHRELRDREGFQRCLQHTLYRPRDILVLLNSAMVRANRVGRSDIIEEDIDATSKQISQDRLTDLLKEYEGVFSGLRIVTNGIIGWPAFQNLDSVRTAFDSLIEEETYVEPASSDIAILGTGSQVVDALYSIGLLGLVEPSSKGVRFCHDGALSSISDESGDRKIAIHPCYWKALGVQDDDVDSGLLVDIHDDYEVRSTANAPELRARRLGQLVSELTHVSGGQEGAREFESWVLRTCRILFAGYLSNIELHPTPDAVQRRDIVATNSAIHGLWKRIFDDYSCRQVIFEVKNYSQLGLEDFRQALSYSGRQYGRFVIIVHRSDDEGLESKVRTWVKEFWDQHNILIMIIPTRILVRCLQKSRAPNLRRRSRSRRYGYVDHTLSKRLDTFERSYVAMQSRKR